MKKYSNQSSLHLVMLLFAISAGINQMSAQCSQWTTTGTTYCTNDPAVALAGTPTPGVFMGPGVTGSNFNPGTAGAGTHQIGYSATSCTDTVYIQMVVQLLPNITLNIPSAQQTACEFDGPFAISGNNPNPGWPTGWFTGSGVDTLLGTFDPDPNLIGWNVITYHYDNGVCSGTAVDSIEVLENPTVTLLQFPNVCVTDPIMTLTQGSGLPTGGSYNYTGTAVTGSQSTGFFFNPALAGVGTHPITYCYTHSGCETCITQNIVVSDVPTVTITAIAPPLCENDGPRDLTPFGLPTGGYWAGPGVQSDSITLKPTQMGGPGTYTLTYTFVDTTGCSDQGSSSVTVNPTPIITITSITPNPTPNPPSDPANITIKICQDDTAVTSITSTPTANTIIVEPSNWVTNQANYLFHPPQDQIFEVVIMANNSCWDTGTVTIDVIPPAVAVITGPSSICIGDTTSLEASGATSYTWINPLGATGNIITVSPKTDQLYQVVADSDVDGDGNKCSSDTGEAYLAVFPLPLVTTGNDTMLFYGDETLLRAYGASNYVWSEGVMGELSCYECNTPIAFPIFDINEPPRRGYFVIGTDGNGCSNGDSIYIDLNTKIVIFVPTAFSPNNDGFNDELLIETKGIASIDFEIFDRFGKTVFETSDLEKAWDGKVDGDLISKDVYLYRLVATPYEKTVPPIEQAGEITVIR